MKFKPMGDRLLVRRDKAATESKIGRASCRERV